jgi:hypothetical protein
MNDAELRERIRERLSTSELPPKPPIKTWGGVATNRPCAVCDVTIDAMSEIEADSADGRTRFYHLHCYRLVALERELMESFQQTV